MCGFVFGRRALSRYMYKMAGSMGRMWVVLSVRGCRMGWMRVVLGGRWLVTSGGDIQRTYLQDEVLSGTIARKGEAGGSAKPVPRTEAPSWRIPAPLRFILFRTR